MVQDSRIGSLLSVAVFLCLGRYLKVNLERIKEDSAIYASFTPLACPSDWLGVLRYGFVDPPSNRLKFPHFKSNGGSSLTGNLAASFSLRSIPSPGRSLIQ